MVVMRLKKIIEKYSFIVSYGVLIVFLISGIIPMFNHNIDVIMTFIGFVTVFGLKYISKEKFDILRFPIHNKLFVILEMVGLSFIFLIEPIIFFVFKLKENMVLGEILLGLMTSGASFSILFLFYNGYTTILMRRIRRALLICGGYVILITLAMSMKYGEYRELIIIMCFIYVLFFLVASVFISKEEYIEVVEGINVYRYKKKNDQIIAVYKELFKGIFVPVLKYKTYNKLFNFEISDKWSDLTERLLRLSSNEEKQLIVNCFFNNGVFCLQISAKGNSPIFLAKVRAIISCCFIMIFIVQYRMYMNDLISASIALLIFFYTVNKFYYSEYLRKKYGLRISVVRTIFITFIYVWFLVSSQISFSQQIIIFFISLIIFLNKWLKARIIKRLIKEGEDYQYFKT